MRGEKKIGMKDFPDPQQHFETHLARSAEKYVAGLQKAGLKPSDRLARAVGRRAYREARDSLIQEATEVRDHNLKVIIREQAREMREIKRSSRRLRTRVCLPIALAFGLLAWYSFSHTNVVMGICSVVGFLAFLAMGAPILL